MSIQTQHHTVKNNICDYWTMLLQHNDEITWDRLGWDKLYPSLARRENQRNTHRDTDMIVSSATTTKTNIDNQIAL